jgi:integral membrane protein
MQKNNTLQWFRIVAITEGISFLVLLLIAMPLKYFAGKPLAVNYVGWAHGVLFVAFLLLALMTKFILNKKFLWLIKAFIASILPFGTFILEAQMKRQGDFVKTKKG